MAQHNIPWSSAFNSLPVKTSKVGQTDTFIRETRQAVGERIAQEHNLNTTDTATDDHGKHLEGSARCFISKGAPTDPSDCVETVYLENGNAHVKDFVSGRQYFDPETKKFYVYVNDYTYLDSNSVSHTVTGFIECRSAMSDSAIAIAVSPCTTQATTAVKSITISEFALKTGMCISVLFNNASCVSALLKINDLSEVAIRSLDLPTTGSTWTNNSIVDLQYDGTYWNVLSVLQVSSGNRRVLNAHIQGKATVLSVGSCTVSDLVVEKAVTLEGFILELGSRLTVKFSNGATVSSTLNVNGTGAKSLYFNGALTTASTWVAGDILDIMYNGTYFQILNIIKSSTTPPINAQAYRTQKVKVLLTSNSGTWTVPANVYQVEVIAVGGGGGGGTYAKDPHASYGSSGGGGGGTIISDVLKQIVDVTPGQVIPYSCGAGGAVGANGAETSFGTIVSGGGFAGGAAYISGYTGVGGIGGAGSNTIAGQAGQSNPASGSSYGPCSEYPMLGGGASVKNGKANYGGGGCSGYAGGDGVIILEYEALVV